uniref:Calcium-transporting ATPase n=1 Tax=Chenopodium quinoa TaxID=63459 RepID=A0A803MGG2_CHEQI
MSNLMHANMACIEFLLKVPENLSKPSKRWRRAVATIYYSRALLSTSPKRNVDIMSPKNFQQLQESGGVDSIASALKTNLNDGIHGDEKDLVNRHEAFGTNTYKKPPSQGFLHFVWEAFKDFTILILLFCAALSLGFGIKQNGPKDGWYDGGSIFVAVFLVIIVSSLSNFRQSKQFEKLSKQSNNIKIDVIRGGRRQEVSIYEIVVGDIVCLNTGDQVPADGLFVDGHSLQIDESSMTGESDHVGVDRAQNPYLVSGTKVADGYGKLGLAVAFLVLVVLLVRYFTGHTRDESGRREFNGSNKNVNDVLNAVVRIVAAAVTIVVVAIPEGLPLAVTLTLAYSMKRMMADQAMVRKLSACETMGSATTICTDKTGTLTQNQMKVTKVWLGQNLLEQGTTSEIDADLLAFVQQGVGLNTTGSVYRGSSSSSDYEFSGSPTEKALLSWVVLELNTDMQKLNQGCTILHVEAFNSQKKRSGVLIKDKENNKVYVHWKGAAEMILDKCSSYYDASGNLKPMNDKAKETFEQIIQSMAASSLRCIAFAHKEVVHKENEVMDQEKLTDDGLTLLGMVGLKDPCRPGVKKAVQDCQNAGVNIKMITGDNVFTARAIAVECGILQPGDDINSAVVEGPEFRSYTDKERSEKVDKIRVMGRSSPFDKLLMVQCLKQKGYVVAVTGDGTNDAPALKEADIGLSMGIQGTEVAKESSDIVILDDNFASVATVLNWGRCVYNNIQKFIQFQLTVNVAALTINFVAAVSAGEVPLTAVQLLWVNLIMDTLVALALATEKPATELMEKAPVGRTEPLITNVMWRNLMSQALYQIAVLLTLQFKGESIFGIGSKVKDTLLFNTFVLCQVFNEFNARKLEKKNIFEGIHKNRLFLAIIAITIILQVVMVEFLKKFANTERLNWGQWGVCIGIAAVSWPLGWLVKFIPVTDKPFFSYIKWQNACFWNKN